MACDLLGCRMADSSREQCTRTVVQAGKCQEHTLGLRNQETAPRLGNVGPSPTSGPYQHEGTTRAGASRPTASSRKS